MHTKPTHRKHTHMKGMHTNTCTQGKHDVLIVKRSGAAWFAYLLLLIVLVGCGIYFSAHFQISINRKLTLEV